MTDATTGKVAKAEAQYDAHPHGGQMCANCGHFMPDNRACSLVAGDIDPQGWSRFWEQR